MPRAYHPADLTIEDLLKNCDMQTTRRSGPGGQHRNKVESAMVITHRPSKIIGQASEGRSQHENRRKAIERLRVNLALGIRTERGGPVYQPSETWVSRLSARQIVVSPNHQDFAAMLAEAMDVISANQFVVQLLFLHFKKFF